MSTETQTPPAPAPAATTTATEPKPEPKLSREELRKKTAAWFDESDATPEEAEKFVQNLDKANQPEETMLDRVNKALEAQEKAKTELKPTETAPEASKTNENPPEAPKEPEAPKAPKKPAKRQIQALDEERIAELSARTAAETVKKMQPEPKREPEPEPETLPKQVERMRRDYEALEELDPTKKGIAERWVKEWKADRADKENRVKEYERSWRKENPNQTYNPDGPEHDEFFKAIEAEPIPLLDVSEEDLDEAHEHRIIKEAEERAAKRFQSEKAEVERRVRNVESKSEIERVAKEAGESVLKALGVESLDKADEADRDVYRDTQKWIEETSKAAYQLVNGLTKADPQNEVHSRVRAASNMLMNEMGVKTRQDPESTRDDDGRYYVDPRAWANVPAAERDQYWTLGAEDIIERAEKYIVDEAKRTIEEREAQFAAYAKKYNVEIKKSSTAKSPPASNGTHKTTQPASRINAPSLSSDVKTPITANGKSANARTMRERWLED